MIDHYDWAGGREAMLRFGPADGPVVIMLPGLFEEYNRTRSFAVTICRMLADCGVASVLPDLPGQGESLVPTQDVTLDDWRDAIRSVLEAQGALNPVLIASMRGGSIIHSETGVCGHWRLSPITGQTVLRDLMRTQAVTGDTPAGLADQTIEVAGNVISRPLADALEADVDRPPFQAPLRTIRLQSDPAPADLKLPGAPLWRRAEPGNDPALAALLADDLTDWVRRCAA